MHVIAAQPMEEKCVDFTLAYRIHLKKLKSVSNGGLSRRVIERSLFRGSTVFFAATGLPRSSNSTVTWTRRHYLKQSPRSARSEETRTPQLPSLMSARPVSRRSRGRGRMCRISPLSSQVCDLGNFDIPYPLSYYFFFGKIKICLPSNL